MQKEDEFMIMNTTASLRQTLRITIDVEVAFHGSPPAEVRRPEQEFYYRELLEHLSAHPDVLEKLRRALAVDALSAAKEELEAEYGWVSNPEQQLLQSVMADLEPAAQAYFSEEIEDGVSLYALADVSEATVKRCALTELASLEGKG